MLCFLNSSAKISGPLWDEMDAFPLVTTNKKEACCSALVAWPKNHDPKAAESADHMLSKAEVQSRPLRWDRLGQGFSKHVPQSTCSGVTRTVCEKCLFLGPPPDLLEQSVCS